MQEGEDGQSRRKESDPPLEQMTRKEEKIIIQGEKKTWESERLSEAE